MTKGFVKGEGFFFRSCDFDFPSKYSIQPLRKKTRGANMLKLKYIKSLLRLILTCEIDTQIYVCVSSNFYLCNFGMPIFFRCNYRDSIFCVSLSIRIREAFKKKLRIL